MGIPIDEWSGAGATKELHSTIKDYNDIATTQTKRMICLTWTIVGLTAALLMGLGIQIWLALQPPAVWLRLPTSLKFPLSLTHPRLTGLRAKSELCIPLPMAT